MFVPFYQAILNGLGTSEDALNASGSVTIPLGMFKLLLGAIALCEGVDEEKYLAAYPDVAQDMQRGNRVTPLLHFARNGYFEGRRTFNEAFDADYYLQANPDVAEAIRLGWMTSAEEHYFNWGGPELRAPTERAAQEIAVWKGMFGARDHRRRK